ncbi:MAG: AAA family ATPase [Hyphomicrobium sp.]
MAPDVTSATSEEPIATFTPADEPEGEDKPPVPMAKLFDISPAKKAEPGDGVDNVVALAPARLSERLAEAGVKRRAADTADTGDAEEEEVADRVVAMTPPVARDPGVDEVITPGDAIAAPGQSRALSALRDSLSDPRSGSHVLVLGSAGTGRRPAAISLAAEIAKLHTPPRDWIYAATGRTGDQLQAYSVPAGTAQRFVRDVQDALSKSSAMLARLIASDTHQMSVAVLEEEHRQRSSAPIDHLKRRAEAQNIALVKTSEGFALAPMHDGRVVKADVFRALPESLQRDVESKVTVLESELQALLGAVPGNDVATDDRHLALCHQTAERAVKPNLAVARKLFNGDTKVAEAFDAIEAGWTRRATDIVRRLGDGGGEGYGEGLPITLPGLQAIGGHSGDGAPVVVARSVGAADLLGEIGRDATGTIAVRPGHLARANGGFLIVDAWRLAADPQAWAALSAALETETLQPLSAPGIAVSAEAVPLAFKLVLIAESSSFAKLKAIDPRIAQYFGAVVNFESDAAAVDISEDAFAVWAAALSDAAGLRKLSAVTASELYDDARARAGDLSRVSLDIATLVQTLRAADALAAAAARDHIASADIKSAIARRGDIKACEMQP